MHTHNHYNQSEQDYLESILMLSKNGVVHRIDVAKRMAVSGAAVNKAMKLLVEHPAKIIGITVQFLCDQCCGKMFRKTQLYDPQCRIGKALIDDGIIFSGPAGLIHQQRQKQIAADRVPV